MRIALPRPKFSPVRRAAQGALLALLAALACFLAIGVAPRLLGYENLVVESDAMGNHARRGDLMLVHALYPEEIEVGDSILVRGEHEQAPRLHRVTSVERNGERIVAWTKIDKTERPSPVPYILEGRIFQPAVTLPYVGYFLDLVETPLGWLLVVALPAVALAASLMRRIWGAAQPSSVPRAGAEGEALPGAGLTALWSRAGSNPPA